MERGVKVLEATFGVFLFGPKYHEKRQGERRKGERRQVAIQPPGLIFTLPDGERVQDRRKEERRMGERRGKGWLAHFCPP